MGADVVLVDPGAAPLRRVLGDRIGDVFARLHSDHGVTLRLGTRAERLRGDAAVEELILADGHVEPADVVVVGIGVTPRRTGQRRAGIRVDNGIVVDHHLESTVPDIYAAGDVANVGIRTTGGTSGSSTGRTPSIRAPPPAATPSVRRRLRPVAVLLLGPIRPRPRVRRPGFT